MFGAFGGHLRIQPDCAGKETTDRPGLIKDAGVRLSSGVSGVRLLVAVARFLARRKTNFDEMPLPFARRELLKTRGKPEGQKTVHFTALLLHCFASS